MANQIINTSMVEIFDENNVRIGYLKKEPVLNYNNSRQDVIHINAATGVSPGPYTPVSKTLDLISDTIEYISLYSYAPVKVNINGSVNAIPVNGQFTICGSIINKVVVTNELPTEVKLDVIQGDEVISGS